MAEGGGLELLGGFLSARDLKRSYLTRVGPPAHITEARLKVERVGFYVHQRLKDAAPGIKETIIRERLSATAPRYRREGNRQVWNKLPLEAGVRRRSGKLQKSVRLTVTGTSVRKQKLSAKVGGGEAWYALIHERAGRLQFVATFNREREKLLADITAGVKQILGTPGRVG